MADPAEFEGRVAVVTGSSSGIGEEIARRLSALGASVVVNSSSSVEAGESVSASLPGDSVYVQADISDPDQTDALVAATLDRFGQLDILVNNAGWTTVVPHDDLEGLTDEIMQRVFDVNVFGTWRLTKAAIPHLKASDDGNVVSITSLAGVRPTGSSIAYAMSKAALNHMTPLLAKSHAPVRFNAVAPGLVDTPWTSDWGAVHEAVASISPMGRSATPADCAEATLGFLRNEHATGQVLVVDGGMSLLS
ncbi:MAG: SDR family oxidoreductase [Acidimicrobiales bacterium]|nr:SDR family oxidoreductase [Acidimicrobiales bacterium]